MSPSPKKKLSDRALSRRAFLTVTAAAGGGLMLGFDLRAMAQEGAPAAPATPYVLRPNAFISIATDGGVTLQIPQAEIGQGVYTSFAQIVAEELDVSLDQVTPVAAPANDVIYGTPAAHRQVTGGSNSISNYYMALRQIGASCRAMLVSAAAQQWKVDPATLRTENGQVMDGAHGGRKLSYGQLAARAAKLPAPQKPALKAEKDFKIIGKSVHRLDGAAKGNGTAQFSMDLRLPGMKVAVLAATPIIGGKVGHVDDSGLRNRPGLQLVVLDDLVAVVGPDFWSAKKGLDALKITWNGGPNARGDSDAIWKNMRAVSARKGLPALTVGDPEKALAQGTRLDAAYEIPFVAHAPMEPMNFAAHVTPGACEMWGGSQGQMFALTAAAKTLGLKLDQVTYHNCLMGGGFGRRTETDFVVNTIRIAQQVDAPVKAIWTREEDMTHDMYRPACRNVMSASLTADGKIAGWNHRVVCGSTSARFSGRFPKDGIDRGALSGALANVYGLANYQVEYTRAEPKALNIGAWRGVANNNNIFAIESLMDELAVKAGKDPLAFRLDHLEGRPRLQAALKLAAEKAGWGRKLGPRRGMGVAAQFAFSSYTATIADVEVDENGEVKIHRFVSAVDAGRLINPDTVVAQVQGGLIFGSTAALYGLITVKDGRVQQTNFNNYRMMRMSEAPVIDVHIIGSNQPPGGIGEASGVSAVPALVNAVAAATGVRLRALPIDRDLLAGRKSV